MATLAVAIFNDVSMNENGMFLRMTLAPNQEPFERSEAVFGPVAPGTLINALLVDLTAFVKAEASAQFGIVFGPADTVQVFHPGDRVG